MLVLRSGRRDRVLDLRGLEARMVGLRGRTRHRYVSVLLCGIHRNICPISLGNSFGGLGGLSLGGLLSFSRQSLLVALLCPFRSIRCFLCPLFLLLSLVFLVVRSIDGIQHLEQVFAVVLHEHPFRNLVLDVSERLQASSFGEFTEDVVGKKLLRAPGAVSIFLGPCFQSPVD